MRIEVGFKTLEEARAAALQEVDHLAAAARAVIRDPSLAAIDAERERQAWLARGTTIPPEPDDPWPLVHAAPGAGSVSERAESIISAADATRAALVRLEGARLAGKAAVRAAATHPELRAALDAARAALASAEA